ncbi:MAG: hypothetical protein ABEJ74_00665 [Haloferacaceae archaeon]
MSDITLFALHVHDGVSFENYMPGSGASEETSEAAGSPATREAETGSVAAGFDSGGPSPLKLVGVAVALSLLATVVAIAVKRAVGGGEADEDLADVL